MAYQQRQRQQTTYVKKKCMFCKAKTEIVIDYKDAATLGKFLNRWNKIDSGGRNGNCTRHQRDVTTAIKRARHLALLPFTIR
jgi:small subunit ribosomal protein S18